MKMIRGGTMIRAGLIGMVIVLIMNVFAAFVWKQPAARAFSEFWWMSWAPTYMVCLIPIISGVRGLSREKRQADRHVEQGHNAPGEKKQ